MVDQPIPRSRGVTRAEFDELKRALVDYEKLLAEARSDSRIAAAAAKETHDKVSEVHGALMIPFPGQQKSLLERMATVTINVESGGRVAAFTIKLAAALAAVGALWVFVTSIGQPK